MVKISWNPNFYEKATKVNILKYLFFPKIDFTFYHFFKYDRKEIVDDTSGKGTSEKINFK